MQLELLPIPPRARVTDPAPSHEAARKAVAFAGTHEEKILAYLAKVFPGSATAEQIAHGTGLTFVQVDRRRAGLVASGRVVIVGTAILSNGNSAGKWSLTPQPERRAA